MGKIHDKEHRSYKEPKLRPSGTSHSQGRQYHIDLDHAPPNGPHVGVSRPREFAKENRKVPKDEAIKKTRDYPTEGD